MRTDICNDVEYDEDLGLDPKWEGKDYEYDSESDDELYNTPANGLSAPINRLAIKNGTPWPVGSTLRVKFLNGTDATKDLERKIAAYAKTWTEYANIKFDFVDPSLTAEIRILFDPNASRSTIGQDANKRDPKRATMHLNFTSSTPESQIKRTTLHEFGHVLGCTHEHSSPASDIKWNLTNVKRDHPTWSDKRIQDQIVKRYGNDEVSQFSRFDPLSIMIYPIPADWTTNGYSVGWNGELSDTDKAFIGQIYPYPEGKKPHPECKDPHPESKKPHPEAKKPHPEAKKPHPNPHKQKPHPVICHPPPPVVCPPPQPVVCPPPQPVVYHPPQPCVNICGDPTCGQTHICDADYNRRVQPLGNPGIDRSKPNPPPQNWCQPTYYCPPRC